MYNMSLTVAVPPLISEGVLWWVRMTVVGILSQCVALLGVTNNIVNMAVFIRLDFKDPMNISLINLSFSDFMGCLTIMWNNLCLFPPFMELELPFRQLGAHFLYGFHPHVLFVKITTLITTFITVERCLCVTFPLKVKEMITTTRVVIVMASIYVATCTLAAPLFYVSYYDWVFSAERNRTLYTLVFRKRDLVQPIVTPLYGVLLPFLAFFVTIASTAVLVYELKKNEKWRQQATGASMESKMKVAARDSVQGSLSASRNQVSSRDRKVANMVVMISALYIICFAPTMVISVSIIANPEIKEGRSRENLFHLLFYFISLLETLNGSLNFFIYFHMSSNYKAMLRKMLGFEGKDKKLGE